MRVLVTGGAGFLGAECTRRLRAAGHDVVTTDRRGPADLVENLTDRAGVRRLPGADAVVHSAAVQYFSNDLPLLGRRSYFHRNNVVATRNLVERYAGSGVHFVNVGTSMVYEQNGRDVYDIQSPWRGQGVYTASKIEAQACVDQMPDPTACVIPCVIAGEGRAGLFGSLIATMRRLGTAVWPGPGRHPIHVVHVRDAASLIVAVLERRATGRFNVASSDPLSIRDWVDEMAPVLGLRRVRKVPLPLPPVAMASALSGYRLLAREQVLMLRFPHVLSVAESLALGWAPRYTNAEIVRETARALTSPR